MRMAVYGIREVRASERVSECVSPGGESEHPRLAFYRPSAQLRAIKDATVVHDRCLIACEGRCPICMHGACKWTVPNHCVLTCKCMQMDGGMSYMHA